MSKQTTALLSVGPKSIAPWGDRVWRIALTAQLVAANSGDYWIATPTNPAKHAVAPAELRIEEPHGESLINSLMMLIAVYFGDDAIESLLIETHNLEVSDGIRTVVPFWDISDSHTFEYLTGTLAKSLRLGVTMMDEISLLTTEVIEELRDLGFDVDVFVLDSVANKSKGRDNIHTSDVLQHPPFESDV